MVGFLRPPATTVLGGQPFQQATVTLNFKMASKMAAVLKFPYYHRLLLYFHVQYIVSMFFEVRESIYNGYIVMVGVRVSGKCEIGKTGSVRKK